MRYFAKSTVLPDRLILAKKEMVDEGLIFVTERRNTVAYFQATNKGRQLLNVYNLVEYLAPYALEIDSSGFILKIVQKLEED